MFKLIIGQTIIYILYILYMMKSKYYIKRLLSMEYCNQWRANCSQQKILSENLDLPVRKCVNIGTSRQYSQHSLIIHDQIPHEHQNLCRREQCRQNAEKCKRRLPFRDTKDQKHFPGVHTPGPPRLTSRTCVPQTFQRKHCFPAYQVNSYKLKIPYFQRSP